MSEKKKPAPISELAAKNLAQIQKIDPCAHTILDKVSHTTLYKFNNEKNMWEKTDVDGTMFVYKRVDRPLFSLMIANRQSPTDFILPITANLKINNDQQYIFICKNDGSINGLWFFDVKESVRIRNLLLKLVEKLSKSSDQTPAKVGSSSNATDPRSAQLLELIKGGKHNSITQPSPQKHEESPIKSATDGVGFTTPRKLHDSSSPYVETPSSSKSSAQRQATRPTTIDGGNVSTMPVLLQKLMIQEQPRNALKEPGTAIPSDELEKDLLRTAKPKSAFLQEFANSPSAVSLAAISNKSVHGSEGDAENDVADGEQLEPLEPTFVVGSGQATPVLNKEQFLSAVTHLLQTDDQFVSQVHQAYIDALNRRLNLD